MNPRYPVYVISKGRWESRLTVKALTELRVPFRCVIEPTEFEQYVSVIPEHRLLVLPFHDLGKGSIPARNWVWQHAVDEGHARHWILDDNIRGFQRLHRNRKVPVSDGTVFAAAEDFTDRYENVGMSGFNYLTFAHRKSKQKPYRRNTRIYSCILIDNGLPFRWRGRYNEDTDLSLRVLKAGYCTVLFNAFLCAKVATMTMKGGNTESLYQLDNDDGRLLMAESLRKQHPDVTKVVRKWGRWQHHVDYSPFKDNKFIKRADATARDGGYGMRMVGGDE